MTGQFLIWASLAVLGVIAIAIGVRLLLRSLATAARARLETIVGGQVPSLIDDRALFFGLASGHAMQLRGNGLLALVDREIVFVQFAVNRIVRIPLEAIVAVEEVRGFRGKTIARPLLQVGWRGTQGDEAAAWFVVDLPAWQAALARARASAGVATPG